MQNLHDVRSALSAAGILISFNGPFSHSIIEELGKAVRKYLENEEVQRSALMDVFSVYVEATQNLVNYANRPGLAEEERQRRNTGIIVIGRQGDRYVVQSGNPVLAGDAGALRRKLEHLATLDKAGLKALYKEQARARVEPGEAGAGLGLIDMARKARQPLEYDFVPEPDGRLFFSLKVTL